MSCGYIPVIRSLRRDHAIVRVQRRKVYGLYNYFWEFRARHYR